MRFLSGIIVGVLLTFATAYMFDATRRSNAPGAAAERPMVNWDVVQAELRDLSGAVKYRWTRFAGGKGG
jgi:hypothetical protein